MQRQLIQLKLYFKTLVKQNISTDFPAFLNPENKTPVYHLNISSSLLLQIKLHHGKNNKFLIKLILPLII